MKLDPYKFSTVQGKNDILRSIQSSRDEIAGYISSIEDRIFFQTPEAGWSGEKNLRHLLKSGNPILLGLLTPRILMRISFGKSIKKSRSFTQLIEVYNRRLKAGRGSGIFTPFLSSPVTALGNKKKQSF